MIDGSGFGIGTAAMPTVTSVPSLRGEGVFYPPFGTATLPTGTSEASQRSKGVFYLLFGTATLPTGTSGAFSRSHCEFVYRIVAVLRFVKFTWYELLLIIK